MKDDAGLTARGKKFFLEYNSQSYISRFTTKYLLESDASYQELPLSLQQQLSDFWDTTNHLTVHGV